MSKRQFGLAARWVRCEARIAGTQPAASTLDSPGARASGRRDGRRIRRAGMLKATAAEIPTALVNSTVRLAAQLAAGGSLTQLGSPFIAAWVKKVARSMSMTKLKTMAICLLLVGGGVYGLALAAIRINGIRSGTPDAAQPSLPAKSRAQPPLKLMKEYLVEPPDMLLVELSGRASRSSNLWRALGAARWLSLARVVR